jgi:hypothetical protein
VGLFDRFTRTGRDIGAPPVSPGLESPNQTSTLAKVAYAEYFVGAYGVVDRLAALQIPAIKKARDTLLAIVAGLELKEYEGDQVIDQPWLYRTKSGISCWHRNAYVFDDLFFYDWSALAVERDSSGQITDGLHIPFERWSTDANGVVSVDFQPANSKEVILIPGNGSGGILSAGAAIIRGAQALQQAWIGRAQNPIPLLVIQQVTDDELEDEEIEEMVDSYAAARTSPTGAVAFADNRVKLEAMGVVSSDLFEEGRNAVVLDIARLTGVPAAILDGSQAQASLTYETQEGRRTDVDDYSVPMWTDPWQARLSLDDVSAEGRVIRFDRSSRSANVAPALTTPLKD